MECTLAVYSIRACVDKGENGHEKRRACVTPERARHSWLLQVRSSRR